jgi:hypothetical protein
MESRHLEKSRKINTQMELTKGLEELLKSDTVYIYTGVLLICFIISFDHITILHQKLFVYAFGTIFILSFSIWKEQPGIVLLLALVFLISTKYLRSPEKQK